MASEKHGVSVSTLSNKIKGKGNFFSDLARGTIKNVRIDTFFDVKRELTETYGVDWAEAERRATASSNTKNQAEERA